MRFSIERVPNWLRWPLAPVASAAAFAVVAMVAELVGRVLVFLSGPRGWSENFVSYVASPGIAGFCAVLVVGIVAPSAKQLAAIAVAGVWMFLAGGAAVFVVVLGQFPSLIAIAAVVVGAGWAALGANDDSSEEP